MKLRLLKPLSSWFVSQGFGENRACVNDAGQVIGKLIGGCPSGFTPLYQKFGLSGHNGLDLFAFRGQPIHAATDGIVQSVSLDKSAGLGIKTISKEAAECEGGEYYAKTIYWHLLSVEVNEGQIVKAGEVIGYANNTGWSSGDHLHFGLKPMYRDEFGQWQKAFPNNGYDGAVAPTPYMVDLPVNFMDELRAIVEVKQFKYRWNYDMEYGQRSEDIRKLQRALKLLRLFPQGQSETGYYGDITQAAVFLFQKIYKVASWSEILFVKGRRCGSKTRVKLNELLN